jgi:aminopeptidase N
VGGQSDRAVVNAILNRSRVRDSSVAPASNQDEFIGSASAGDSYLPDSGNGGYAVSRYGLELEYRIASNRLTGTAVIGLDATQNLGRFSFDLVGLAASAVSVDGVRVARFAQTATKLIVALAKPVAAGAHLTVTIKYGGSPAPRRSAWGEVGWEELSEGVLVASQPSGAPTWFPCNDHPSDKATYGISITVPSAYRAIANGRLVSTIAKASKTRRVYESSEPMATYLATLQIGQYVPFAVPPVDFPQNVYIPADLASEAAADLAAQPAMIRVFERLFGPYPFAEYTVVVTDDDLEIPLEAQGLSIFGRNHVDGEGGSERLIAHELAHSWFGNSLTAASWKDIWLHEGFACYAEWLWSENSGGPSAQRLAEQQRSRLAHLSQDLLIGDPGAERMFDDRLYKRGALTLHAMRLTLGDDRFFRMLREWTDEHRHGSVTTEQFIAHAEDFSQADVRSLLHAWLYETALPRLPRA